MDLSQDFDYSCYGLRENPKKTRRVSFSDKKQSIDDKKSRVSLQFENAVTGFEVLCPIKKKRSKLRYKASGFCSVSNFNSKFSEFGREEDAALSMVMLSSGFTKWADFISDFDSSENDSLMSKAKAFNGNKMKMIVDSEATGVELENKIGLELAQCDSKIKFGEISFGDQDTELGSKLISCDFKFRDFVGMENCNFVSEISEKSKNKLEFKCKFPSFQGLVGHEAEKCDEKSHEMKIGFEQKKKVDFVSDCDSSEKDSLICKAGVFNGNKMELNVESENTGVELGNINGLDIKFGETEVCDQETEFGAKLVYCDPKFRNFVSGNTVKKPVIDDTFEISFSENRKGIFFRTSEETSFNDQDIELGINGFVGMEIDDYVSKVSEICENKPEFKCKSCSKKFPSFQALGGHRAKKHNEKSNEMEKSSGRKKSKGVHECPICFKVFPSGQALGGHKRAHFNGFSENKNKGSAASVVGFSFEKQFGSGFGLIPCGTKSDCGLAPVVISN